MSCYDYKICLALPVKTGNFKQIKGLMAEVLEEEPDFIELRFDYIEDVSQITPSLLEKITTLTRLPLIFTLRNSLEGGYIKLDSSKRIAILKRLINAKPRYLDIEIETPENTLREVLNQCNTQNVTPIFSYHNFESTNSLEEAQDKIKTFIPKVNSIFESNQIIHNSMIFKMIFTANKFEDNLIPLNICKSMKNQDLNIISFCMGDLGLFSRIMCVQAGAFFTYAALHKKTAPGQINIRTMKRFYSLLY